MHEESKVLTSLLQQNEESSATHDHEHFPDSESPIQVRIRADQQPLETDEDVLHKQQFNRLMTLLPQIQTQATITTYRLQMNKAEQWGYS